MGMCSSPAPATYSAPPEQKENWALQNEALNLQKQQNEMLQPYLLSQSGLKMVDGQYVPMTEEEKLAQMNPLEASQYQSSLLQADRLQKALRGELPVSPSLENELARQQTALFEDKSRTLGTNWMSSTPGAQSLAFFNQGAAGLREGVQKGEIDTGTSLLLQQINAQRQNPIYQQQLYGGVTQPNYNYMSGLNQFGNTLGNAANTMTGLNIANVQAAAAQKAGLLSGIGSMVGTGGGIAAAALI